MAVVPQPVVPPQPPLRRRILQPPRHRRRLPHRRQRFPRSQRFQTPHARRAEFLLRRLPMRRYWPTPINLPPPLVVPWQGTVSREAPRHRMERPRQRDCRPVRWPSSVMARNLLPAARLVTPWWLRPRWGLNGGSFSAGRCRLRPRCLPLLPEVKGRGPWRTSGESEGEEPLGPQVGQEQQGVPEA